MAKLYNLARMTTATTGTGTITLGSAVGGFLTFAQAGATNGETVAYGISDGNTSEVGTGVYTSSGTTLTRSVTTSTNSNSAISLSGTAQVYILARAQDLLNPANNLSDVADPETALTNLRGDSTGDVKLTFKITATAGWVMMNDGTIGDASSGATTRANADCLNLFTLFWDNISNSYAAVSGGRGASAAADWTAHKTIALPKSLGRSLAVAGAGSGLTSRSLGQTAGAETETPTLAKTASHNHVIPGSSAPSGSGSTNFVRTDSANNVPGNTSNSGSGDPLNILDPSLYLNAMIKL